jgi:hypothetical protein
LTNTFTFIVKVNVKGSTVDDNIDIANVVIAELNTAGSDEHDCLHLLKTMKDEKLGALNGEDNGDEKGDDGSTAD